MTESITPTIIVSIGMLLVYIFAFLFSRKSWLETYRPILTAEIKSRAGGNQAIAFEIVVHNVGNRPATDIQLTIKPEDLRRITSPTINSTFQNEIERCFSQESRIAILQSGCSVKNGFAFTKDRESGGALIYGASSPIEIRYKDLNQKKYKSILTIIVKDSHYFANSGWEETPQPIPEKSLPPER